MAEKILAVGKLMMNLRDEPLLDELDRPLSVGEVMGGALMSAQGPNDVKLYLLSLKLRKGDTLTLDEADYKTLKEGVDSLSIPRLQKAQMVMVIDEAKDKKAK